MSRMFELGILLSLVDTASSPLRAFGSALEQTAGRGGNAMQRLGERFDQASAKMTMVGASAAALGAELGHLAEKPIHAFMEMDSAMNDLAVATLDKTGKVGAGFDAIRRKVLEIDGRLPMTTAQVAEVGTALKSAGVTMEQMLGGAYDAAANLSVVLKMPGDEAGLMVARLREAYGLAGNELPKMADLVQRARFAFGIAPEELKVASAYAAPTLNMLGLTGLGNAQKLLAMQGMGAGWNFQGSSFGTNFSMFLTRLSKGPQMIEMAKKGMKGVAREQMIKAGVKFDFYDKKGHLKSLDDMVSQLETARNKLKKAGGDKMVLDVFGTVFGAEAGRAAEMLAEKGVAGYHDAQKRMADQASLDQRIGQTMQSAENIWTVFTTNVTNALATLGEPAVKWIEPMVSQLGNAVAKTREWTSEHQQLAKWIVVSVGGIGAALTAFGALAVTAGIFAKVAGGPLRLIGRLIGKKGGKLGTIGHALEEVGVQKVFVVNMPGGGLPIPSAAGGGSSGFSGLLGADGKPIVREAEKTAEAVAKPVGRIGRALAAIKGAPGVLASKLPFAGRIARMGSALPALGSATRMLGKIPGRGLLRKIPWLGVALTAADVAGVATSNMSSSSKKAAYTGIAGSAAGSAAGGAIGAAVGSVVPVLGTMVGGLLGAAIGGWAGQKIGDWGGAKLFAPKSVGQADARSNRAIAAGAPGGTQAAAQASQKPPQITVEYHPQITIQGDPIPGTAQKFEAMLREHQATIAKMIKDIMAAQHRTAYSGS